MGTAMSITISSGSGSGSTGGKILATIFLSIFAGMGLVFTAFVGKAGFDSVRPYFWGITDCVIESASVNDRGNGFDLNVRYTYRFDGRSYTGSRFRAGMSPSNLSGEEAQRAAVHYAAGSRAQCYVNSSSPAESTLERGVLWPMLFLLIPLVFVAFGVGGIIGVWRTKSLAQRPVSERHRAGGGATIGLRLFGFVFMCVGGGLIYAMAIRPMLKEAAAAKWPRVPCEILSSRVTSQHGNKGGYTYSIEMRYRYTVGDRRFVGTRYNFETGSSSSRKWREDAVAYFPPGLKTSCFVNPVDPVEAVLSVKPSPDRWFGLIPGVFLIIGLAIFIKAPAMARRGRSRTGIAPDVLPPLPRDSVTGDVELKPSASPGCAFAAVAMIALFWNGIVWTFLLNISSSEWAPRIFLGIFAIIGIAITVFAAYHFLALFNPRPVLTANAGAVPLGGTLAVRWRFTGNARRLAHLTITLEGREEATYPCGKSTNTDRNLFAILPLLDTAGRDQFSGGSAKITVPRGLIHTFTATNNKIVWTLRVAGGIPRWPDVNAEFAITVLPRETATLFQEQNPTP
jgi:hypothetical protein